MYKEIYDKENGDVHLTESKIDERTGEEFFDYDKDNYTDEQPSSDLYRPIYYDEKNKEWIGTDYKTCYDEYMENKDNDEFVEVDDMPSEKDIEIARLTKQVFNGQKELEDIRQDIAKLVKELNKDEEEGK